MAEGILFNIVEQVLKHLGSHALEQMGLALGVPKKLKKLENQMTTIKGVLLDAERQQRTNTAVQGWLQRLRDVSYDANDLLDVVATQALHREVAIGGSMAREVRYFFTRYNPVRFNFGIGRKLKDIEESLDEIVAEMRDFNFVARFVDRGVESTRREETYSFIGTSEVIGRNKDKEAIIKRLMCSNDDEGNVSLIPIVGMGGLGKTTLSQLVYNNNDVAAQFNPRLWVCVSNEDLNLEKMIGKILKATTGTDQVNLGVEQIQNQLRKALSQKKFLLVLDDVWNEDRVKWVKLKDLLMVGAPGSKVVVTTRSKTVASIMGTMPSHDLRGLSNEDCLGLLLKWADVKSERNEHQHLIEIGKSIARKCGGNPLAARTLGGLLYLKTDERDWLGVRDSEIWNLEQKEDDILPALRLSYDQMPFYLKPCFSYCSLLLKGKNLSRTSLISHWIAQGYIMSSNVYDELEDIGELYFRELLGRSFIQQQERKYGYPLVTYRMHDLVHDLAQSVARSECLIVKSETTIMAARIKHVAFDYNWESKFPTSLWGVKKLRSFLILSNYNPNFEAVPNKVVSAFKSLRVLDLNCFKFELPDSIGHLIHLRYFSLYPNDDLKKLPNSICNLLNLRFFDLSGCSNLGNLPQNFGTLINLRDFGISTALVCLPEKAIGCFISLRALRITRSYELTHLPEALRNLYRLRELDISNCLKLTALPKGMRHLSALEHLSIGWCRELNFSNEDLEGLTSLQSLRLEHLEKLVNLPKGLKSSQSTLKLIDITDCRDLTRISGCTEHLTSLETIAIRCCYELSSLPGGFDRLRKLRTLSIMGFEELVRRCEEREGEDWEEDCACGENYNSESMNTRYRMICGI